MLSGKPNFFPCLIASSELCLQFPRLQNFFNLCQDFDEIKKKAGSKLPLVVWLLLKRELTENVEVIGETIKQRGEFAIRLVVLGDLENFQNTIINEFLFLSLPENSPEKLIYQSVFKAHDVLKMEQEFLQMKLRLALSYQEMQHLTEVGKAFATERDFSKLIDLILQKARELVSADGGSIYITEFDQNRKPTHLRFIRSALVLDAKEFLLPIDKKSIAGYVALTGEPLVLDNVYELPSNVEYSFNSDFDKMHNYYTKSMIVVPMKNHLGEVIGVLQLINKKNYFHQKLTLEELKSDAVKPFTDRDYEILLALAGLASVAIENNQLIQEIENLFEGFVKAAVTAIEQRDPTTSGHSFRVADYTVHLAEIVDKISYGVLAPIRFSRRQMREIRYASLLHDFGKVGVREHVLVKAKKLYPHEFELIKLRFQYIRKALEAELLQKHLEKIKKSSSKDWPELEKIFQIELKQRLLEVEKMFSVILDANEPTVLEEGSFEFLKEIAKRRIHLTNGEEIPFLLENELLSLSVRKGTLGEAERKEIESHVVHTYNFLRQIPWTKELKRVPEIAYGHHEKLDGSGYPQKLTAEDIPYETRMMTIADIYDALTAWDRPYKKAIPPEKALDILNDEAKQGRIDKDLLKVFIEAGVYRRIEEIRQLGHDVSF